MNKNLRLRVLEYLVNLVQDVIKNTADIELLDDLEQAKKLLNGIREKLGKK